MYDKILKLKLAVLVLMLSINHDCHSKDYSKAIQEQLEYNNYDKAFQLVSTQKKQAKATADTIELIKANNSQGLIYKHMLSYELSIPFFVEVVQLSEIVNYYKGEYSGRMNLGYSYSLIGKYDDAIEHTIIAYDLAVANHDTSAMARAKMAIGNINYNMDDYEQADRYFSEAFALAIDDTVFKVKLLVNTSVNAIELGEYDKASNLLDIAESACILPMDRIDVKLAQGELGYKKGDIQVSILRFQEALKLAKTLKDKDREAISLYGLGRVLMNTDFYKSESYLKTAYSMFESVNRALEMVKVGDALFSLYMDNKKYDEATATMELLTEIIIKPKELAPGMSILLNQTANLHEIKIELENSLAEEKLRTQSNMYISAIIIIVLLFIFAFVFMYYRREIKANLKHTSSVCESRRKLKKDLDHIRSKSNQVKSKAIEINAFADLKTTQHLPRIKKNSIEILQILDDNS
ncbi:MAG: tetratricopeptide repeat protein [Candidatus Kapabacteria bacterium]|nr:tetratricopeptide repeat protein [Candidatus Kapabacteria bacterium]